MATSTIPNPNLSFDTTPTSGSSKPVTSNGIYNAIQQSTSDKAYKVVLSSAEHNTWAKVYAVLSTLPLYETGTIYSGPTSTSMLTDGNITTNVSGTISRTGDTTVYAQLSTGTAAFNLWITDMVSSSRTTRIAHSARSSYFFIEASSATTFTIPNNSRILMLVMDSSTTRCGLYFVVSTGAGAVSCAAIGSEAGQTTITAGTNSLTITSTSGSRSIMFIDATMANTLPTIVT